VALLAGACGYALVGKGVTTDPSIKRIGVPLFRDRSNKPGLDQKITQKVIEELLKRGRFDVVPQAEGADAVVDGEIVAYLPVPVAFSDSPTTEESPSPLPSPTGTVGETQASRYSITVIARVRYAKTGVPEPIWSNDAFEVRDEYDVGDDPSQYFDQEEQAMERLAITFARNLVAAMLEAF
jgi:hypothetical protein